MRRVLPAARSAKIFTKPVTLGFSKAAGYQPTEAFMYFALAVEIAVAMALILGIQVQLFAGLGAAFMAGVLVTAMQKVPLSNLLKLLK